MAAPMGFEPTTHGLTDRCSNQLSYRAIFEDSSQISEIVAHYFTKELNGTSARIWTKIDGVLNRKVRNRTPWYEIWSLTLAQLSLNLPTYIFSCIGRHWYKIKRRWYIIPVHNYNNLDIVILRGGVIKRPCTKKWWVHVSIWIYNYYKSCHNLFSPSFILHIYYNKFFKICQL